MSRETPLTPAEGRDLEKLENVVGDGLRTFVEVGNALAEINRRKLYRVGHSSWDAYCRVRWGMAKSQAYRLIVAAGVVNDLAGASPIGDVLPVSESQARELGPVPPENRKTVWEQAVEDAGGQPSAGRIRELAEKALAGLSPDQQMQAISEHEEKILGRAADRRDQDDRDERTRRIDKLRSLLRQAKKTASGLGGEADTFLELLKPLVTELNSLEACA